LHFPASLSANLPASPLSTHGGEGEKCEATHRYQATERQQAKSTKFFPAQAAVQALPALAELNAILLRGDQQSYKLSSGTRPPVGPVFQMVRWDSFEDSHEGRIFLLPAMNEEFPVT
jgi:hypothetical protein